MNIRPAMTLPKPGAPGTSRGATLGMAAQIKRMRMDSTHASLALSNLMVSSGLCRVTLDENFKVRSLRNGMPVLGTRQTGIPVSELFGTQEAASYFDMIREWAKAFRSPPQSAEDATWQQVFPAPDGSSRGMDDWIQFPPDGWKVRETRARAIKSPAIEWYLVSPHELIGPGEDFRIEYSARAETEPRDLSVVVGGRVDRGPEDTAFANRPEDQGYCFAFGGLGNSVTELQRCLLPVASQEGMKVIRDRNHLCEAERVGGLLRFAVDGIEAYRYADPLPIFGPGAGHVALYACAPDHVFWDVKVFTRPTCLTPDVVNLIPSLRRVVLALRRPDGSMVDVEVCHLGSTVFIVKELAKRRAPRKARGRKKS